MSFIKSRLGVMMFLQYGVWGVWLPILSIFLQAPESEGGAWVYGWSGGDFDGNGCFYWGYYGPVCL